MREGLIGQVDTAEHACNLLHSGLLIKLVNTGASFVLGLLFTYKQVLMALRSSWPTISAVGPPMPTSTSSNTSVGTREVCAVIT